MVLNKPRKSQLHLIADWLSYLYKTITEVDLAEVVSSGKVTIQGRGVELRQDEHFIESTVDTIAHRHIDQPVRPSNRHLQETEYHKT